MRIFALFNLKPGVSRDDYLTFARTVDLPTVNGLASIDSFRVFESTGLLGSDAAAPYGFIEVIDINDMAQFGADVATQAMQDISATFGAMADVTFITTAEISA